MAHHVVVGRGGRTTIPVEIRKRLGIEEGTGLRVDTEGERIVFRKMPSLFDLAGTSQMTRGKAIRLLDRMRKEN